MKRVINAVVGLVLATGVINGVALIPGATVAPDPEPDPSNNGTLLVTAISPYIFGLVGIADGNMTSTVWSGDPDNALGGLSFQYTLTAFSAAAQDAKRYTLNGFLSKAGPWNVDARVADAGASDYEQITRDKTGETVGADFEFLLGGVSTDRLILHTDAPAFTISQGYLIDGDIARFNHLSPAVPEPQEYALLAGLGLLSFVAYRRMTRS
jgi:hypothetical protein